MMQNVFQVIQNVHVHVLKCTFQWALKFEFSQFLPSTGNFQENPVII